MLDHFRNDRRMSSSNLSRHSLSQINHGPIDPILIENTVSRTKRRKIRRNHTPDTVHGPENEKHNKQVMRIPETLKVCASRLFDRCSDHEHEGDQHNPSCPGWACQETSSKEAREALAVFGGELGYVVQMRNCVYPGEEYNCPCDH